MKHLVDAHDDHDVESSVRNVYERVEEFCKKSIKYYNMAPWSVLSRNHRFFPPRH
jgi:hypothetical protein